MSPKEQIRFFEEKIVRTVWDEEKKEWYFWVFDDDALTDSAIH